MLFFLKEQVCLWNSLGERPVVVGTLLFGGLGYLLLSISEVNVPTYYYSFVFMIYKITTSTNSITIPPMPIRCV